MKTIYKYEVGFDGDITTIKEAQISKFLSVKLQPGVGMCVWAEIDDTLPKKDYQIVAIGTGWMIPSVFDDWEYIGTEIDGARYVWHYYWHMMEKSKEYDIIEGDNIILP